MPTLYIKDANTGEIIERLRGAVAKAKVLELYDTLDLSTSEWNDLLGGIEVIREGKKYLFDNTYE